MSEPQATVTHWALPCALWVCVFCALSLSAGFQSITSDALQMCDAAAHLVDEGTLQLSGTTRGDVVKGPDGHPYTKYPLLAVLECVPAVKLRTLGAALGGHDSAMERYFVGLTPACYAALGALGFFFLALQLGFTQRLATLAALLLVFTTPLWHYARSLYTENLQATLLIWTLWVWLRARGRAPAARLVLGGFLLGLGINLKILFVALPLAVVVDRCFDGWDARAWARLVGFAGLGALPGVLAFLAYNHLRFGDWLSPGYTVGRDGTIGFHAPLITGLYGLLFSSGKSVFLYAPLLLAMGRGLGVMRRERQRELCIFAVPVLFFFIAVAKWWSWSGDIAWGPRLVVPVIPLLFVPVLWSLRDARGLRRALLIALCGLGVYVAVLGIAIRPYAYIRAAHAAEATANGPKQSPETLRDDLSVVHFVPDLSPLVGHHWLLWRYLRHEPWQADSYYPWRNMAIRAWAVSEDPGPQQLNFWCGGGAHYPLLLANAAVLLLALTWLGWCWRRSAG